ncbi:MAG: hypothetical protein JNM09_04975 [Blastocatellia bacterium]|nr:hypothetical protein [Blastocatellia bacterium]
MSREYSNGKQDFYYEENTMIHHISLDAKNPRHVATVLAEIMGGQIVPAPPNFRPDSWFVLTGDQYGTLVEVLPLGTEMMPDDIEAGFHQGASAPYVPTHAYISVQVNAETLQQIGKRENWFVRVCDRGPFDLVEFWIENRQLIEFAPPEMAAKYLNLLTNPQAMQAALADLAEAR